ncbi:RsfA family transcriptional regulator [Ectobacillus ponti]|uniref:RsfA family transcriptional regulator n=1 Tax=Ectobacillus ponti TaxID=2961894 RepID=A0AA41X290_9BACI|nr:RsfA family transcriptional regulator [Ectobacillus ponti]MCP8967277.1 RsfA family transcriptional regulator [Ectobacillus ponti]
MKTRQDAWTAADDVLLAETVLRHIREGSTQLKAFDEVGDLLNRTSAACGFRWNAEVRQSYEEAVQLAKRQRKELKRALAQTQRPQIARATRPELIIDAEFSEEIMPNPAGNPAFSLPDVIAYLQGLQHSAQDISRLQVENQLLARQNEELKQKNEELEKRLQQLSDQQSTIQEDYEALIRIMDRARKMVLLNDQEERLAPIFKMDQNGNLDIISQ